MQVHQELAFESDFLPGERNRVPVMAGNGSEIKKKFAGKPGILQGVTEVHAPFVPRFGRRSAMENGPIKLCYDFFQRIPWRKG
jgi:hypothetical protein